MTEIWNSLTAALADAIAALHGGLEPVFGVHAWGWAIIALTLIVRVLLLPLAIKQTRSMRAMQTLQPEIKKIQKKHKTDRDLLKKDPQKYQERKKKMNEEVMALYKEHDVNPASGCLPLLPQIPIFFALFSVLRSQDFDGAQEHFYFFTDFVDPAAAFSGLGAQVNEAGWPGWLLVIAMAATMFITQRQMMARTNVEGPQAQQQKIMLYVMPVFLAVISQSLPLGVLLYWVTTNVWQGLQQFVILKEVQHTPEGPGSDVGLKKRDRSTGTNKRAGGSKGKTAKGDRSTGTNKKAGGSKGKTAKGDRSTGNGKASDAGGSKGKTAKGDRSTGNGKAPSGKEPAGKKTASSEPGKDADAGTSRGAGQNSPNGQKAKKGHNDHLPRRKGRSGRSS